MVYLSKKWTAAAVHFLYSQGPGEGPGGRFLWSELNI